MAPITRNLGAQTMNATATTDETTAAIYSSGRVCKQYEIIINSELHWKERGRALLALVKLDLDQNDHTIAGDKELNEDQLRDSIIRLFLGNDAAMADIELDVREKVRNYLFHKNLQNGNVEKSGEELFAEVRQNPIVEEAISAVINDWEIGSPV